VLHNSQADILTTIERLKGQGVKRYHADLLLGITTFYMQDELPNLVMSDSFLKPASRFSDRRVSSLLRCVRMRSVSCAVFLRSLSAAGCVGYFANLESQEGVFYGYSGDGCSESWAPRICDHRQD
jgi:hypothetical protein